MVGSPVSSRPRSSRGQADRRRGCEVPRIFTPPLRELNRETSLGFTVIDFAADVLQIELLPWQKWLLIHALELLEDGSFRFRNVVVLVARQNGKSTLSIVLALWFIYVLGSELVLGTAQDLDTAEEVWQGAVDLVEEVDDDDQPVRPDLHELLERVVKVNGKKALELKTGQRYKVKAASRKAGRGLSGDLILMDELREQKTWAAWGAITKTTMARPDAQIWSLSNAGDSLSIVLDYLRRKAHLALGDPDGLNAESGEPVLDVTGVDGLDEDDVEVDVDDLGIFEWSATPGIAITDRAGWAQANPSLGYTITERTIASAVRTDPEAIVRTEVLCQWVESVVPPFVNRAVWADLEDPDSAIVGEAHLALEVAQDHTWSCIAAAGYRDDGTLHVQVVENHPGVSWVPGKLAELTDVVTLAPNSPAGGLITKIEAAGLEVTKVSPTEYAQACGQLYDRIYADPPEVHHVGQPELNTAVRGAQKKISGDAFVFDRKSDSYDISPLAAVALASHTAVANGPSVYESQGVRFL